MSTQYPFRSRSSWRRMSMISFLRSTTSLCISRKHCLTKACTSAVLCACLLERSLLRLPMSPFTCSAT